MPELLILSVIFLIVSIASRQIGKLASQINLPYITGYLLTGLLVGPFVLGLLPTNSTETLRYIDEIALAAIAFVAGSELYLPDLRDRFRSIAANTLGIVIASFLLTGTAIFFLTELIPFTQGMPAASRIAVAVLGGTVLLALSPASTIAVMQEVRARGPFSQTVLSVTVFMDVFIIVIFAVAVAAADVLLVGSRFDIGFAALLLVDILAGIAIGVLAGVVIRLMLSTGLPNVLKIAFFLAVGYGIFVFSFGVLDFTHDNLPFEIHIEPILSAMTAGFFITNFTEHRRQFEDLLHDVGPIVYVAFFTLTGVSLKLDILLATLPIAGALFVARAGGIFAGAFAANTLIGESRELRRFAWMGLITQAGIALGLAREVAIEFPALGDSFATMIISVVVLNEVFGPLFLKNALRRVGETNLPDEAGRFDEVRDVVIFGIEEQSLALARQLKNHNWVVRLVDTDRSHVQQPTNGDIPSYHIDDVTPDCLEGVIHQGTDAVVALLPDDEENYRALQMAYETCGVPRLIVRLNDLTMAERFQELGSMIVEPASAMVNLLDQAVRVPQTVSLLTHATPELEIVQVTITNKEVSGKLIRDLRLPGDVLFLDIVRNGNAILPNGYTRLHLHDEVTLIGQPKSLEAVTLLMGY